ncbi:MAG: FluC/FEX family fluoride channel [Microbacteriaceae bacterium]
MTLSMVFVVLVAGALGSVLRFWLSKRWPAKPGQVPRGILVANLVGSGLAGIFAGIAMLTLLPESWMTALIAGFCGGLTTFSTWAIDTVLSLEEGNRAVAIKNVAYTIVGSVMLFAATMVGTLWALIALFSAMLG